MGEAEGNSPACPDGVQFSNRRRLEEVLPVMVRLPGATAGMVMPVLKGPEAVVVTEKVADPAMTVPVVEALKPVPETVTAEPAGHCTGSA